MHHGPQEQFGFLNDVIVSRRHISLSFIFVWQNLLIIKFCEKCFFYYLKKIQGATMSNDRIIKIINYGIIKILINYDIKKNND